jgi:hypothetical protein
LRSMTWRTISDRPSRMSGEDGEYNTSDDDYAADYCEPPRPVSATTAVTAALTTIPAVPAVPTATCAAATEQGGAAEAEPGEEGSGDDGGGAGGMGTCAEAGHRASVVPLNNEEGDEAGEGAGWGSGDAPRRAMASAGTRARVTGPPRLTLTPILWWRLEP